MFRPTKVYYRTGLSIFFRSCSVKQHLAPEFREQAKTDPLDNKSLLYQHLTLNPKYGLKIKFTDNFD